MPGSRVDSGPRSAIGLPFAGQGEMHTDIGGGVLVAPVGHRRKPGTGHHHRPGGSQPLIQQVCKGR